MENVLATATGHTWACEGKRECLSQVLLCCWSYKEESGTWEAALPLSGHSLSRVCEEETYGRVPTMKCWKKGHFLPQKKKKGEKTQKEIPRVFLHNSKFNCSQLEKGTLAHFINCPY